MGDVHICTAHHHTLDAHREGLDMNSDVRHDVQELVAMFCVD